MKRKVPWESMLDACTKPDRQATRAYAPTYLPTGMSTVELWCIQTK